MNDTTTAVAGPQLNGISVVLPAHNEADNIVEAVRQALHASEPVSRAQEVIVVDDGSTDGTLALASELSQSDPRVRVVHHETNRGYGGAVRSGISAARMDWLLLTDADLQFDLGQLVEFVPYTREASLVVGYRANRRDPLGRRMNAHGWNALVNILFDLRVRDVDAAFKLVRRSALDGLDLVAMGAAIDAELLAKARDRGADIVELPVRHLPRVAGRSSGANLHVIARAFREVFGIWWQMQTAPSLAPAAPATQHPIA